MNRKGDIEIGYRSAEFIRQLARKNSEGVAMVCKRLGIGRNAFYGWVGGAAPSARHLQSMTESGADAHYLLTGRKRA